MSKAFSFAFWFVAIFCLSYGFLAAVDALPEPLGYSPQEQTPVEEVVVAEPEAPIRVVASAIGMDNTVLNPTSQEPALLDEALLQGTIRYPTSALLGVDGTVALFGHSSYLPIVRNQNYKAFNGIQKLKAGDIVSVYSQETEYRYEVQTVHEANAEEAVVPLRSDGKFLVLVTCDSFGKKSNRFVVSATFVGAYAVQ